MTSQACTTCLRRGVAVFRIWRYLHCLSSCARVPNLGYMYPSDSGYICLSEGVHLLYSRNKLILRH